MGRRSRRRTAAAGQGERRSTSQYIDDEGGVLTLRDSLSEGTRRQLQTLDAKPAASAEDRWQRRVELLFEHLAVRWEIAGLPMDDQRELLGRYRMASGDERRTVRAAIARHLSTRYPEIDV